MLLLHKRLYVCHYCLLRVRTVSKERILQIPINLHLFNMPTPSTLFLTSFSWQILKMNFRARPRAKIWQKKNKFHSHNQKNCGLWTNRQRNGTDKFKSVQTLECGRAGLKPRLSPCRKGVWIDWYNRLIWWQTVDKEAERQTSRFKSIEKSNCCRGR